MENNNIIVDNLQVFKSTGNRTGEKIQIIKSGGQDYNSISKESIINLQNKIYEVFSEKTTIITKDGLGLLTNGDLKTKGKLITSYSINNVGKYQGSEVTRVELPRKTWTEVATLTLSRGIWLVAADYIIFNNTEQEHLTKCNIVTEISQRANNQSTLYTPQLERVYHNFVKVIEVTDSTSITRFNVWSNADDIILQAKMHAIKLQ